MSCFDGNTNGMTASEILLQAAGPCQNLDRHLQDEGKPESDWEKFIRQSRSATAARQKAEVIAIVDERLRELGLLKSIPAGDLIP